MGLRRGARNSFDRSEAFVPHATQACLGRLRHTGQPLHHIGYLPLRVGSCDF